MFDCIIVPDVSTCAIARYLLSSEIDVDTTLVDDIIVLNNEVPWLSNNSTTVLYTVSTIVTATYPFLFTVICEIFPSISLSHNMSLSAIKYSFCPFSSAIAVYLLLLLNIGFDISIVSSFSFFPVLSYIEKLFLFSIPIFLLNAYMFELLSSSISILGKLFCVFSF